jgi:hypothetical protein
VQIFEWYADGMPIPQIIDHLVARGIPSPRRTRWTIQATRRILGNERYRGYQIWGASSFERRPRTNRRVQRRRPREEWQVVERPELRIISDDLWVRVADRRAAVRASLGVDPGKRNLARGRSALYSPYLFSGFLRCGTCGGTICIVSGGQGSPRYGCPNSSRNGLTACDNRLTIRATVADPMLLAGLQTELQRPEVVHYVTEAVSEEVSRRLDDSPRRRDDLLAQRVTTERKLQNLIRAVEDGIALPSVRQTIAVREAELRRLDEELQGLDDSPKMDVAVIPTWVRQQLRDVADLLRDKPERAKVEFRRLNVSFTLCPVHNEGRPFLRAIRTGDFQSLCGYKDLRASTGGRSGPESVPGATVWAKRIGAAGAPAHREPLQAQDLRREAGPSTRAYPIEEGAPLDILLEVSRIVQNSAKSSRLLTAINTAVYRHGAYRSNGSV